MAEGVRAQEGRPEEPAHGAEQTKASSRPDLNSAPAPAGSPGHSAIPRAASRLWDP